MSARISYRRDAAAGCLFAAFDYWRNQTAERHNDTRLCLENSVAEGKATVAQLANLVYLDMDEHRRGFNPRTGTPPLIRAVARARQAVTLAPSSPRAHQALMGALFVSGNIEDALKIGERAAELNPYDTDILADLGARYIQAARFEKGLALLRNAAMRTSARPPWYDAFLFLGEHLRNQPTEARKHLRNLEGATESLALIAQAIAAHAEGEPWKARQFLADLVKHEPAFATDPREALARRVFAPAILDRLVGELRAAGLTGPQ
jgi:tetratricopeptide (TPR) repeat protein